jgi:copper(I)-binding protein
MNRNVPRASLRRTATSTLLLAALATACSHPVEHHAGAPGPSTPGQPGQVDIKAGDIDLNLTHAVVHLDPSGDGTLTMTLHNGGDAPEHLAMVATAGGGRGTLRGSPHQGDGALDSAGILVRPGATVTFGGTGRPQVRFTGLQQAATSHTMPLTFEFGIAGLIHLEAVVQKS